jgi:hypothetical protein
MADSQLALETVTKAPSDALIRIWNAVGAALCARVMLQELLYSYNEGRLQISKQELVSNLCSEVPRAVLSALMIKTL